MLFDDVLDHSLSSDTSHFSQSEWAESHFLNPKYPEAVRDDPTGEYHKELQITKPNGDPLTGLQKGDQVPLILRPYQKESMNIDRPRRVHRWGRRTGKTFQIGVEIVTEALRNQSAQILVLAPAQNQVKLIFDDYVRPLLRAYRHRRSGRIGIKEDASELGRTVDFVITKDTQKPQEIVIRGVDGHKATIRGMVVSNSARGQTADFVILDEADYADTEKVQGIVTPILMSGPMTRMLMVSTPSGRADTYFRNRFDDDDWWSSHQTFEVLPHYDQDMHDLMAKQAGGEDTNVFRQEWLAQWGTAVEGVFDQRALGESFIITPYPLVMEEEHPRTRERTPLAAADSTDLKNKKIAYYEGVRVQNNNVRHDSLGSTSLFRPQHRNDGVISIGTDWNDVAGMQTVVIWWPSEQTLSSGKLKVARYPYEEGAPITTRREKADDKTKVYRVGQTNGNPGGPNDLSEVRGIVIWHDRLERGAFSWQSAANRVCSIMGISNFANVWYVDKGYGTQANSMIKKIMHVGEWEADMDIFSNAEAVDNQTLENMRGFDPERDPERTGRKYRPILFGNPYEHSDIDFSPGKGRYKDVMINLTKRMVVGRQLLFPHKELIGYHRQKDMGNHYKVTFDMQKGDTVEEAIPETDRDKLEANGAEPARGEAGFGGLVTQMQTTKIDGYTPTGRPRYKGDWHAVDGLMLAVLAYWENFSEEGPGNMFRSDGTVHIKQQEDVFRAAAEATRTAGRRGSTEPVGTAEFGSYSANSYSSARGPLKDIIEGRVSREEAGTSLQEMFDQAFGKE